jgi:hypothetical protein
MAQGVGPEFKPPVPQKKEKKKSGSGCSGTSLSDLTVSPTGSHLGPCTLPAPPQPSWCHLSGATHQETGTQCWRHQLWL